MAKDNAWRRLDQRFTAKHPEIWKFVKSCIAGGISNIPELGVQMLCLYLFSLRGVNNLGVLAFMEQVIPPQKGYSPATVVYSFMISTAVGYAVAFVLNRKATFHADSNVALSTFLYVLMVIFTIFVNGLAVGPLVTNLVARLHLSQTLTNILAKVLCMLIPFLWTYPLNRFVIHRQKKDKSKNNITIGGEPQ